MSIEIDWKYYHDAHDCFIDGCVEVEFKESEEHKEVEDKYIQLLLNFTRDYVDAKC